MDETTERTEWVDGLHQLADFVESHPDLPLPYVGAGIYVWDADAAKTKAKLAELAGIIGNVDKSADDYWFRLVCKFGPHSLSVRAQRQIVCERVVVGTKTETRLVAPEGTEFAEVTETVELVEWVCPPSILAFADAVA